ncbi:protein required for attachment to host cells [Sphingomonas faeni]|jgi:protein required for attachment to host cells|uniref:Protein required for attachment to host cells n=1 Tax=Sphingomonas faeni TaxID=185950 RepID=A0A2T5TYV6_9SPHN|nr:MULTISPECIES: host attachment family protein [Sphingomonas]KQM56432.1 Host attachment protein [Sphingomonas sp. Leaf208]MDD1450599.1 host attachment family protein [Sphingomonas sp. H160509]PTW44425.1 protein required for attachment to host cells [Sphingomonas faeni]QCB43038.1 host attachment protein [Sphingomonas sp. PAMC26645]RKE50257.1 protein required for attachment to host cells [Sphingomonas sp. PP-CC-1A-547]
MHLPHNSVVLVADGRKMLFLRNEGDAEFPNLVVEKAQEQDNPATRDQATDSAGRASSPQGGVQSSVEPTDFHQIEEDRFAADAADFLKTGALKNKYDSLIVIAPPKTLGELRKHYHKEVTSRLKGELDKDLTGHPIKDIEKALMNA